MGVCAAEIVSISHIAKSGCAIRTRIFFWVSELIRFPQIFVFAALLMLGRPATAGDAKPDESKRFGRTGGVASRGGRRAPPGECRAVSGDITP